MGFTKNIGNELQINHNKESDNNDFSIQINDSRIDTIINAYKNSGYISLYGKAMILEKLNASISDNNSQEINDVLSKLASSNRYEQVSIYINELEKIVENFDGEKTSIKSSTLKEKGDVISNVDNFEEFIKYFLDKNTGYLDNSLTKVTDLTKEASELSEVQIVEKIKGLYLPFDVEQEDWEKYFKDNNIPKDKQAQIKKYYSKLLEDKDFGNLSLPDFGGKIDEESERILKISNSEAITINIDELNPSLGAIKFTNKKDALLYLYYNKILFREVATFMEDIQVGVGNVGIGLLNTGRFIADNPVEFFYGLLTYMSVNTFASSLRYLNAYTINKRAGGGVKILDPLTWFPSNGQMLNPSSPSGTTDANITLEQGEVKRRLSIIKSLREQFAGNQDKLRQIEKVEQKYLSVLDNDIDIKNLKKSRYTEATFWREISYIEGSKYKWIDIPFKLFLRSTESVTEVNIRNQAELKNKILKEFFPDGKENNFIKGLRRYIELSHHIGNSSETENIKNFEDVLKDLKDGKIVYEMGKNEEETIKYIRNFILSKLEEKGLSLENDYYEKVKQLNDVREFIGDRPKSIFDKIRKDFSGMDSINDDTIIRQLNAFYEEIYRGNNKYEFRTAVDIITRILNGKTMDDAIKESFDVSSEVIEKIQIKGNSLELSVRNLFEFRSIEKLKVSTNIESNNSEHALTNEQIIEKTKNIEELYQRAILQAELEGKEVTIISELSDKLDSFSDFDSIKTADIKNLELEIIRLTGFDKVKNMSILKGQRTRLFNKLVKDGFLVLEGGDIYKVTNELEFTKLELKMGEIGKIGLIKYVKKSYKTGG